MLPPGVQLITALGCFQTLIYIWLINKLYFFCKLSSIKIDFNFNA